MATFIIDIKYMVAVYLMFQNVETFIQTWIPLDILSHYIFKTFPVICAVGENIYSVGLCFLFCFNCKFIEIGICIYDDNCLCCCCYICLFLYLLVQFLMGRWPQPTKWIEMNKILKILISSCSVLTAIRMLKHVRKSAIIVFLLFLLYFGIR